MQTVDVTLANWRLIKKVAKLRAALVTRKALGLAATVLLGILAVIEGYPAWRLHQTLAARQVEELMRLPLRLSANTTLVDIRIGLTSLTYVYKIEVSGNSVDATTAGRSIRAVACGSDLRTTIRDGASYIYEYHDPSNAVVKFEISSCP